MELLLNIKNIFCCKKRQKVALPIKIQDHNHCYYTNGILSHNTTTTSSYLVWQLVFHNDKSAMVVANKGTTGKEIVSKMKDIIEELPYYMKPGIINMAKERIKFENGSLLRTAAASKTPATGDSIQLLYVDEAALIPSNIIDDYWASVYPTLSSFRSAQIIMSSTPRGRGNLFYRIYSKAIPWNAPDAASAAEEKKFISSRVDWWEVPGRIGTNWEQQQRDDLGDELFNQEFGLSFDTGTNRLVSQHCIGVMEKIKKQYVNRDMYKIPETISKHIFWHPDFNPSMMTYEELLYTKYLFCVDTSQGLEQGAANKKDADYNVINIFKIELMSPLRIERNREGKPINIMDVVRYKQVGVYYDNFKNEESCSDAAKYLCFNVFKCGYGDIDNVRILVEMNFNGNNWLNRFKTHPNYYEQVILKTSRGTESNGTEKLMLGFRTKSGNHGKNYYCEKASEMMHKGQIMISQYDGDPNHSTVNELQMFGKNKKGNYMGIDIHDDLAYTSLIIPIATEQDYFKIWVEEWLETLPEDYKVNKIREMLQMYVEEEPSMSDEEFTDLTRMASQNFGKITMDAQPIYNYGLRNNNASTGLGGTFNNRMNIYNMNR